MIGHVETSHYYYVEQGAKSSLLVPSMSYSRAISADGDLPDGSGALVVTQQVWFQASRIVHRQVPHVYLAHLVPQHEHLALKVETEADIPNVAITDFKPVVCLCVCAYDSI